MRKNIAVLKIFIVFAILGILFTSLMYALDREESRAQEEDSFTKDDAASLASAIKSFKEQELSWTAADKIDWTLPIKEGFLDKVPASAKDIFVARGSHENDKVWACFIPVSKHERVDTIKLRSITPGDKVPDDGLPKYCENRPDWNNSFCFICVSQ